MEQEDQSFLGRGWNFPPRFNSNTLQVEMVEGEEDIRQSLWILISTLPGERILKPLYGCDLHSLVFERLTVTIKEEIIDMLELAIIRFEPRIILNEIQVEIDADQSGLVKIIVDYRVRRTNSRSNIVYPYYLKEGTNITSL
jgi:phage baseplate assembly protein W